MKNSLKQEVKEYELLASRQEIDTRIAEVAGKWSQQKYQFGILVLRRLDYTPESEKDSFFKMLRNKYGLSKATVSECKTVAQTYSSDDWLYYIEENGLYFSHLYYAAYRIADPSQRKKALETAINKNMTVEAFRKYLDEIVPSETRKADNTKTIKLSGILTLKKEDDDSQDLVVVTPEDSDGLSLSQIFSGLINKDVTIHIKYKDKDAKTSS